MRDSIEVKRVLSFDDLDRFFWSGARDKWDDATDEQKKMVWERILDIYVYSGSEEIPSETEINDLVWFECDDIFFPKEDEDDEEKDESIRRRRNLRQVIESRRRRVSENKRRHITRK